MSIVKMKRIRLIALAQDRDALLSSLLHVGCVEISEPEEIPQGSDGNPLLHRDAAGVAQAKAQLTALQLLCLMKQCGTPLSQLAKVMQRMPQVMLNVAVSASGKLQFYNNEAIKSAIAESKERLGDRGRVLVRVSGTEPLVRVMVEGEDPDEIRREAEQLADLVKAELA